MRSTAQPPDEESNGHFKLDNTIDSTAGNFVIVDLLRNGEKLQSEIYELDSELLSRIGNKSEWVAPNGVSTSDDNLHWRLMENPNSYKQAGDDTTFHTEMRYDVAKPYSY